MITDIAKEESAYMAKYLEAQKKANAEKVKMVLFEEKNTKKRSAESRSNRSELSSRRSNASKYSESNFDLKEGISEELKTNEVLVKAGDEYNHIGLQPINDTVIHEEPPKSSKKCP